MSRLIRPVGVAYPLDSPVFLVMMCTAEGVWPCDVTKSLSVPSSTSNDRLPTNRVPIGKKDVNVSLLKRRNERERERDSEVRRRSKERERGKEYQVLQSFSSYWVAGHLLQVTLSFCHPPPSTHHQR